METELSSMLAKPMTTTRDLVKQSWGVFISRWVQLVALELFTILPAVIFAGIIASVGALVFSGSDQLSVSTDQITVASIVFIAVLGLVAIAGAAVFVFWGTCAKIVYLKTIREESSLTPALKKSWGMLRGFVGVGLLQGLSVLGGFILLIIPGIYLMIKVLFAQYAYVFERDSGVRGIAALRRSSELTRGFWWGIATRLLSFSVFIGLLQMAVRGVLTAGGEASVISGSEVLAGTAIVVTAIVSLMFSLVTQALYSVFQFTIFEHVYRIKHEEPHAHHPFSLWKRIGLILLVVALPLLLMTVSILAVLSGNTLSFSNSNVTHLEAPSLKPTENNDTERGADEIPFETVNEKAGSQQ